MTEQQKRELELKHSMMEQREIAQQNKDLMINFTYFQALELNALKPPKKSSQLEYGKYLYDVVLNFRNAASKLVIRIIDQLVLHPCFRDHKERGEPFLNIYCQLMPSEIKDKEEIPVPEATDTIY